MVKVKVLINDYTTADSEESNREKTCPTPGFRRSKDFRFI